MNPLAIQRQVDTWKKQNFPDHELRVLKKMNPTYSLEYVAATQLLEERARELAAEPHREAQAHAKELHEDSQRRADARASKTIASARTANLIAIGSLAVAAGSLWWGMHQDSEMKEKVRQLELRVLELEQRPPNGIWFGSPHLKSPQAPLPAIPNERIESLGNGLYTKPKMPATPAPLLPQ